MAIKRGREGGGGGERENETNKEKTLRNNLKKELTKIKRKNKIK